MSCCLWFPPPFFLENFTVLLNNFFYRLLGWAVLKKGFRIIYSQYIVGYVMIAKKYTWVVYILVIKTWRDFCFASRGNRTLKQILRKGKRQSSFTKSRKKSVKKNKKKNLLIVAFCLHRICFTRPLHQGICVCWQNMWIFKLSVHTPLRVPF